MKILNVLSVLLCAIVMVSCDPDEEVGDGTGFEEEEISELGEKQELKGEKDLIRGTYRIKSWTAEEAKDWNNDGVFNTDLLNEIDPCLVDNELTIHLELYWKQDMGVLCEGTLEEGERIVQNTFTLSYQETTGYNNLTFETDDTNLPESYQQIEYYIDEDGRKSLIGNLYDHDAANFDILVLENIIEN